MKLLFIGILLLSTLTSYAGEVNIKGYWDDQIVIVLSGNESKELYHNLNVDEIVSSTVNGESITKSKRAKNITCNLFTDYNGTQQDFECVLAVDSKGRVSK